MKQHITFNKSNDTELVLKNNLLYYKIPDKYYTEDYELLDCQFIHDTNEVLYIFKTSSNSKEFYIEQNKKTYYYELNTERDFTESGAINEYVLNSKYTKFNVVDDVNKIKKLSDILKSSNSILYDADINTCVKRIIDYRLLRKQTEPDYDLVIMYCDIEIYTQNALEFPDPNISKYPISAISFKLSNSDILEIWAVKPNKDIKEQKIDINCNYKLVLFDTEYELLNNFLIYINQLKPDILTGWNFIKFDFTYIINRALKFGLDINLISPLNNIKIYKGKTEIFYNVYGLILLDMLELFKSLTFSQEESYSLANITKKYLNYTKIKYEGSLDKLYETEFFRFIEYNATDTLLLESLNQKFRHIELKKNMARICNNTWFNADKMLYLVDSLSLTYAKKKGLLCKSVINNNDTSEQESLIPGAYVRDPIPSLHKYVVDFDFSSLYPSLIKTYNIGPDTYIGRLVDDPNFIDEYRFCDIAIDIIYNRNNLDTNKMVYMIADPLSATKRRLVKVRLDKLLERIEKKQIIINISGCLFINQSEKMSFLNEIITDISELRTKYKNLMKQFINDEKLRNRYNNIQYVYKVLLNSFYGVLANTKCRFFSPELASSISLSGREVVKFTGWYLNKLITDLKNNKEPELVDTPDYKQYFSDEYEDKTKFSNIIYQDTDSIFFSVAFAINNNVCAKLEEGDLQK